MNQPSIDAQKVCNAALLFSRTVAALIELEAMRAENQRCAHRGMEVAYGEGTFITMLSRSGIQENDATMLLQGGLE